MKTTFVWFVSPEIYKVDWNKTAKNGKYTVTNEMFEKVFWWCCCCCCCPSCLCDRTFIPWKNRDREGGGRCWYGGEVSAFSGCPYSVCSYISPKNVAHYYFMCFTVWFACNINYGWDTVRSLIFPSSYFRPFALSLSPTLHTLFLLE